MEYEVLSPRGDVDPIKQIALNPRVPDLNNATIGLFSSFKEHWALILDEVAKQIQERYPGAKFTRFRYKKDLNSYTQVAEVAKDPEIRPQFEEWAKGVDAVIVGNADAGSCTLYLTYNATLPEHLGKPTVLTVFHDFVDLAKRAAELRGVPKLRYVPINLSELSMEPDLKWCVDVLIPERVSEVIDDIIAGLTKPLTAEEAAVPADPQNTPRVVTKGSFDDVNKYFYQRGWCWGALIKPPTEEAVREMLTGTDLAAGPRGRHDPAHDGQGHGGEDSRQRRHGRMPAHASARPHRSGEGPRRPALLAGGIHLQPGFVGAAPHGQRPGAQGPGPRRRRRAAQPLSQGQRGHRRRRRPHAPEHRRCEGRP